MIEFSQLNVWAIIVSWVITVVLGAFWYSPVGFGKLWSKLSGVDMMKIPKNEANRAIIFVAIGGLILSIALAITLRSLGVESILNGITAALVLWAGFTAATTVGNTLYQRLSLKFWFLNASFYLIVMLINSVVLTLWK